MEKCIERDATLPILFFKVILKANLQRLKIPNRFTAKYGDGLPNPLFIKVPNGTEWKVNWEKDNGEIWLRNGWKEFVEYYSLDHGHFVFFKYEGTSQIRLNICDDQSAVEINYPCGSGDGNDNLDQNEEEPIIILDEEESPEQIGGETSVQRTSSLNQPNQTRAREVACNFVSCNPFFTVLIKHAIEYWLCVPDLKDIIGNKCAVLQLGEISWKVKLLFNNSCFAHHSFGAGIHLFLTESEMQPGDVCVFELISKEDCVFKVHIFKRSMISLHEAVFLLKNL